MLGTPNMDINHSHAQNLIHTDRFRYVPPMDEMVVPVDEGRWYYIHHMIYNAAIKMSDPSHHHYIYI